jgi:thymidylate synthase
MFHGAYGLRTRGQYHHVVQKLTDDPSSRQAVVTLWNPEYDNLPGKRDYPCTIMHQFRIRDGALNMSVYMRSNDVWLGLAYDGFQFTRVQIALAHVLGVEVGTYTHHVGSLHLYDSNLTAVDKLAKGAYPTDYYKQPAIVGSTWDDVEWNASSALHAAKRQHVFDRLQNDSERWFASSIRDAVAKNGGSASLMTVE